MKNYKLEQLPTSVTNDQIFWIAGDYRIWVTKLPSGKSKLGGEIYTEEEDANPIQLDRNDIVKIIHKFDLIIPLKKPIHLKDKFFIKD